MPGALGGRAGKSCGGGLSKETDHQLDSRSNAQPPPRKGKARPRSGDTWLFLSLKPYARLLH